MHNYSLTVGSLRLAPTANISVEEPNDFETITTSARDCDTCPGLDRSWKFKLYLKDCTLEWAWAFKARLDTAMCEQGVLLTRTIGTRTPISYLITGGTTRLIQTQLQYQGVLAIELVLKLKDYVIVSPFALAVVIPTPTLVMVKIQTAPVKTLTVTVPSPTVVLV